MSRSSSRPRLLGAPRHRGTSLVEVLVVIVVFLVGILAVAQIFPQGFRVLTQTRDRSLATTLARAEAERLKARPDLLPEQILPVKYVRQGGVLVAVVDESSTAREFAPTGFDSLSADGDVLSNTDGNLGNWARLSGANRIRRVIGESHVIGANRFLAPTGAGAPIEGGLVALQYGPMDFDPNSPQSAVQLSVYGPNMSRVDGPRLGDPFNPVDVPTPAEYRISDPGSADALLTLPADTSGSFRLSLAAYFNIGGAVVRREITDLPPIFVTANANKFEAFNFRLIPGLVPTGATFVGVDLETVQVARNFDRLPSATAFDPDNSFQYKLVSGNFGFILFNSSRKGYDYYQVQSSSRQAFPVRINYDVYDWRILHEDFVVPSQEGYADAGNPNATGTIGQPATLRLAVTPMKSTSLPGADGLRLDGIEFLLNPRDGYDPRPTSDPASDHFILLDLETGGVFYESFGGQRMIEVNKSTGLIRFPVSTNGRASGRLYLPDGTSVAVPMEGRSVRALYMGRDEWAMQVLRAPAHYTRFFPATATDRPGNGTYYIGGTGAGGFATRLYFPLIDRGRKVSVTRIAFLAGGNRDSLEAVDAVLKTDANDPLGLPFLDIRDVNGNATGFDLQTGFPVRDVRGASAAVRVFHNDTKFRLTSDGAANVRAFERYLRLWKVDTKETYLTDGVR